MLLGVREENQHLQTKLDQAEMENQYLRAQLSTAESAKTLAIFQASSQSKTVAAHVIANTTDTGADGRRRSRLLRRRSERMAVITPEGIVGKVISVYPNDFPLCC